MEQETISPSDYLTVMEPNNRIISPSDMMIQEVKGNIEQIRDKVRENIGRIGEEVREGNNNLN